MSTSRWKWLFRDLGAAFAFSSLLFSFLLPTWVVFIFGSCLLLAFLGLRPLQKMEFVSALLLLAFAVPLFASAFLGKTDFVIAACCFSCIFSALRMMGTPNESTDAQVHLGALLMMTGGAALTGELWYLFSLFGFAVFTPISMGMGVLQYHGASSSEIRPALYRIGMGIGLASIGMLLFFIFLPRLSWKIGHVPLPRGMGAVTGLADTVKLQSNGDIKTSPRIIARIELKPDPKRSQLNHYWVARYYRDFDGKEWHSPRAEKTTDSQIVFPRKTGRKLSQQIELLPAYGSATLIALDRPFLFLNLERASSQGNIPTSITEFKESEIRATINATSLSYHAQSFLPGNEAELFSADTAENIQATAPKPIAVLPLKTPLKIHRSPSTTNKIPGPSKNILTPQKTQAVARRDETLDAWLEDYKQLPENMDARIAKLAQDILKTEKSPIKAARLIENYLSQNLQYALETASNEEEPLANFLFTKKRGHCEQFATAFAVLLRQGGFASRVVGGFFGGEQLGNRYILRAGDAHAWTQVYDERLGWVSFDATPPVGRQARLNAFLAWALEIQETLDAWWQSNVVDYSIRNQTGMVKSLLGAKTQTQWKPFVLHGQWQWLWLLALPLCILFFRKRKLPPETRFLKLLEKHLQKLNLLGPQIPSVATLLPLLKQQNHPLQIHVESAYGHYLRWRFGNIPYRSQTARKLLRSLKTSKSFHLAEKQPTTFQ